MIIHDSEFQAKANVAYTSTHTKLLSWEGGQEETILEAQERTTERTTCGQQVYKCYPLEIKTSLTHSLTHRQTILFTHTTSDVGMNARSRELHLSRFSLKFVAV